MKKNKKYRPGRKCFFDGEEAVIRKAPFKCKGDTFVIITQIMEAYRWDNNKSEIVYYPQEFELRVPIDRVTLK